MKLSRRNFIKSLAVSSFVLSTGCGKLVIEKDISLDPEIEINIAEVLYYASLAPSGHNTQPWLVRFSDKRIEIYMDSSRTLPEVDPSLRETCMSTGAFLENAVRAFNIFGYDTVLQIFKDISIFSHNPKVAQIEFTPSSNILTPHKVDLFIKRHTDKRKYIDRELKTESIKTLKNSFPEMHCYTKGTDNFKYIRKATIEANIAQANAPAKQQELANWLRFSNKEAKQKADGLPAEQLGLSGAVKTLYYWTTDKKSVQSDKFVRQTVNKIISQVDNCSGFFVLEGGYTPHDAVMAGMRMQAFWLLAAQEGILLHPMSQILEEAPWSSEINASLGIAQPISMIFRAGYAKSYKENNRIRRPLNKFVTTA